MNQLPDNRELKCYLRCIFIASQMMDEASGMFNVSTMYKMAKDLGDKPSKIILRMSRGCFKAVEEIPDACEKSYHYHRCMKMNDLKVGVWQIFFFITITSDSIIFNFLSSTM